MRWQGRRQSENVEDDRRGGRQVAVAGGGIGLGTLLIILLIWLLGGDPQAVMQQLPQGQNGNVVVVNDPRDAGGGGEDGEEGAPDPAREFVGVVLADTEEVWTDLFAKNLRAEYRKPTLRLFAGGTTSGCGEASSSTGPFYCPVDRKVYLDTDFFREMQEHLNAPGDFARAYVIAHEVGHHVQNLLGLSDQVQRAQQRGSKLQANELSVRLELQADYLAGVWANHAQKKFNILEEGDIEAGLNCAAAIGDDRLQRASRGYVVPDAFTHGSSRQRVRWFTQGLKTGEFDKATLQHFFDADEL